MDKDSLYEKLDEDDSLTDAEKKEIYFYEINENKDVEEEYLEEDEDY